MPRHSAPYDFVRQRTEILADMQHFGIKTRLMDWSFSPLVALYFALEGGNKGKDGKEDDSEVWVLNPWEYRDKFFPKVRDRESLPHDAHVLARALLSSHSFEDVKRIIGSEFFGCVLEEVDLRLPFPFVAKYGNPRLIHQAGAFTIHGGIQGESAAHTALDEFDEVKGDPILTNRIVIPKDRRESILDGLSRLFINEYTIYPDLEGMSRHLKSYDSLYSIQRKKKDA